MSKIPISKEQSEINSLQASLKQAQNENRQKDANIKAMFAQKDEAISKNANLSRENIALQKEIEKKNKQLSTLPAELEAAKHQLSAYEAEVTALRSKNEHIINSFNDSVADWEKLSEQMKEKERQFTIEFAKAQESLDDKSHVIQQQKAEIQRAQQEAAEERLKVSRMGTELKAEQSKSEKLEKVVEDLTQDVSEAETKLTEAMNQLTAHLETARKDRSERETLKENSDNLNRRIQQLEEEGRKMEAIIGEMKTAALRSDNDLAEKDQALRLARNEIASLQSEVDRISKVTEQRAHNLNNNATLLSATNTKLQEAEAEVIALKEKLRASELDKMTQRDAAIKATAQVQELTASLQSVRQNLDTQDGVGKGMSERIASLEKDLANERSRAAASKTSWETHQEFLKSQTEIHKTEIARLKSEINLQKEHIEKIHAKHNAADEDRVVQSETITDLRAKITNEVALNKKLSEQLKETEGALEAESKLRSDAQIQISSLRTEKAHLADTLQDVTNERDSLKGKLASCEDLLRSEQSKNRVVTSDGMSLGLKVERLTKELELSKASWTEMKAAKEEMIAQLEQELSSLKNKLQAAVTENNELNNAAHVYKDRSQHMEKSLKDALDGNKKISKELAFTTQRKEEYKNLARDLTNRREREQDFNTRIADFHKLQIAALKENAAVLRKHIDGFVKFQRMVATAVEMGQSRMEDFVGEEVWADVLSIQQSTEAEKIRADAASAQLQRQYDALKAEYQQHIATHPKSTGAEGLPQKKEMASDDKENTNKAGKLNLRDAERVPSVLTLATNNQLRDASASVRPPLTDINKKSDTSQPRSLAMPREREALDEEFNNNEHENREDVSVSTKRLRTEGAVAATRIGFTRSEGGEGPVTSKSPAPITPRSSPGRLMA